MPDETPQSQQPAPPPPSYQRLGLGAKFVMELKKRLDVAARVSKLEKVKALHTDNLKAFFVEALLQVPTNPANDDFKDLVRILPDMGAMCSVIGYRVGIVPGSRKSVNPTKLRLALTDYDLTMEDIDKILAESTDESTWGEMLIEPLNPNSGKKKLKKKAPAKRKAAPQLPVPSPVSVPLKRAIGSTQASSKPKAKALTPPAPAKKGGRRGMIKT